MKLTIIEKIVVLYWYLLDTNSYNSFEYWKNFGLQTRYAFEKVFKNL